MQGEQHKGTLVTSEVDFLIIALALHCISLDAPAFSRVVTTLESPLP